MSCEYCHTFPHLPGCPNEPEPKVIHTCDYCRDGILIGDEFVTIGDEHYHVSCLSDEMNIYEVLGLFDVCYEVAQDDT